MLVSIGIKTFPFNRNRRFYNEKKKTKLYQFITSVIVLLTGSISFVAHPTRNQQKKRGGGSRCVCETQKEQLQ